MKIVVDNTIRLVLKDLLRWAHVFKETGNYEQRAKANEMIRVLFKHRHGKVPAKVLLSRFC